MNSAARGLSSEESVDDVLDSMPCGFISTLPDGTITQVNATFLSWTGHSRAALLAGQRFQDLLTVPGRIFYETHFAPLLRMQGFVKEIACQMKREGREPLQVLVNSSLNLDVGGRPLFIRTVVFDATDRAKYEEELRRARNEAQHLAAIVTASGDAIISLGFDLVVRTWNPGATLLFGYAQDEAVGRAIDELIVPEDRRAERARLYDTVRSGGKAVVRQTVRRRKDGSLVQVEITASPIRDAEGRATAISVAHRDITERKRAETALRQSHDTYLSLIENNPFGVYLVDADFRMAQASAAVRKVFGAIVPLIGRDFGEIVRILWQEPVADEIISRFRHTLETGERFHSKDTTGKRANRDAEESYDWQIERVSLPSGRFGVVCYFYDLTERKRYEQHIQLLMGEVNHRAKNLLSVVQAIARETARSGDPSTFAIHLSERIRGLAASQDLLVKNQWTHIAMSELVHAQLSHLNDLIGTRILLDGPPVNLSSRAAQGIGMALHELATNAAKYGALSNASGRVRINWGHVAAAKPGFTMQWLEEGGPEVAPPTRKGFGNTVIGRMVEASVDGKVEIEYRKSGLYWRLAAPDAGLLRAEDHER